MIQADDLVCDVFSKYPKAFDVFERHGMCDDCKSSPPPVPVTHFVSRHCDGRIEEFLQELNSYIQDN